MSKHIKRAIVALILVLLTFCIYFCITSYQERTKIREVQQTYIEESVQERIEDSISNNSDLLLQIDGEKVVGVIKIDKIGFEGLVYQGTTLETLDKGVGHFENSSYFAGNVCLAAHNSDKYWARLNELENGDKITYTSFLGTKEYEVAEKTEISETDWSKLQNSDENILTLITCVKGEPTLRLCVQAFEVK